MYLMVPWAQKETTISITHLASKRVRDELIVPPSQLPTACSSAEPPCCFCLLVPLEQSMLKVVFIANVREESRTTGVFRGLTLVAAGLGDNSGQLLDLSLGANEGSKL